MKPELLKKKQVERIAKCKSVYELLTASRFTKMACARTQDDSPVSFDSPDAVKFDLMGAINRIYGENSEAAKKAADKLCKIADVSFIDWMNDCHSHAKVRRLVKLARI